MVRRKKKNSSALKCKIERKLRNSINNAINKAVKRYNINYFIDFSELSYTAYELKKHLEDLFEPWMNWDNWKRQNKNIWKKYDSSTWTWKIEFINDFKYADNLIISLIEYLSIKNIKPVSTKSPKRKSKIIKTTKICKKCKLEKDINEFRMIDHHENYTYFENMCQKCHYALYKQTPEENRNYYINNKKRILIKNKQYREMHKEEKKIMDAKYKSERIKNDVNFKLRITFSKIIGSALKRNASKKNKISCMKYLSYTIKDLKIHLESLFEPWMNWSNYGIYNSKTWIDNDCNTWKWNIDHIIPQSLLPYDSMEHPNFLKCWCLSNLRPLSAKQNLLDGVNRVRHKKVA